MAELSDYRLVKTMDNVRESLLVLMLKLGSPLGLLMEGRLDYLMVKLLVYWKEWWLDFWMVPMSD